MGRADHQVRVSGYRVELGEIEAAMEERPDIGDAAVLQAEQDGVRALVACVRPRVGVTADQGTRTPCAPASPRPRPQDGQRRAAPFASTSRR
ncbi:hypothetical protein AB0E27_32295 [Streptomyces sparsogenes]|uniref:hypothetical protein n=1 Tax=Streptomyces sparsogenes TaxID=67365 RepID=UPI00340DC8F0